METISIEIIIGEFLFIILLFLRETGVLRRLYEELYTHPESTKTLTFFAEIFADMLYVVGGSSIASSVFIAITTTGGLDVSAFTFGLAFAIIGKYLKEKKEM